jgi:hypothetical protein
MILKDTLRQIVLLQRRSLGDIGIKREVLDDIDLKTSHVIILSGIRRCGKSTLLKQLMKKVKKFYYFNFEDQRVSGFELSDFEKLDDVFHEEFGDCNYYFLDEIQNVDGWERFVRKKQDERKKFIITGSNASLLSRELGTKLTGRHLTYELFPFSYGEMLLLRKLKPTLKSFKEYFQNGGFPEFLKYRNTDILQELFRDIISRDIVVKNKLKEAKTITELSLYLLSNIGKEFSYNKLKKYFNMGSTNTIISYISYLEDSYLFFVLPKFDYSYKKQIVNPKKIYSIDVGLSYANSVSFSSDKGRILENLVFLHLRKKYKDIFYFKENYECDFVIRKKGKDIEAVQVCFELNADNKERELRGLEFAMNKLKIKKGTIVTFNQEDKINGIKVMPYWKWVRMENEK